MSNRGGKRPGAGRPPLRDGLRKTAYATKLTPWVVAYLRQCDNAAETIETAIRRSKAFRDWDRPPVTPPRS